jgi:pimeloyl-ACP methyl ester carboxylesterase
VAAPTFARQAPGSDGPAAIRQMAGEVHAIVRQMRATKGPAAGLVDGTGAVLAGHSLGGAVVYAAAYHDCCRIAGLSAAMTFEGALVPPSGDAYRWRATPLLAVLGDADPLIPYDTRLPLLRGGAPTYLVTILGGTHGGGIHVGDPGHAQVPGVVDEFLRAFAYGDAAARAALHSRPRRGSTVVITANAAARRES